MDSEIIVCNSTKTKDIKNIEKAIEKLKMQEKKLVDLYLSSTLNVETINNKNDIILPVNVIERMCLIISAEYSSTTVIYSPPF